MAIQSSTGTSTQSSITIGSGSDTLILKISEDAWQGDAEYTISVDGQQIGGILTAHASHALGQDDTVTVMGNWAVGSHTVSVNFLNDAYGGPGLDRNLYVDGATYDGVAVSGGSFGLYSNGAHSFTVNDTTPVPGSPVSTTVGSGSDSLVLKISEDAWQGDAQYTVSVDGQQIGSTLTAHAWHSLGQDDTVTVMGNWAVGTHTVSVKFLNDAYGGPGLDRNLYVDGATYDGGAVSGASFGLYSNGAHSFSVNDTTPVPGSGHVMLGVNLAGAEFGSPNAPYGGPNVPATYGADYTYPTHSEIDYYTSKGMEVIRVPFFWERMQSTEFGGLNSTELSRMDDIVNYATSKGLKVILDLHNYGYGFGSDVGTAQTPNSAFADFWGKFAGHYSTNPNVMFGLMNEPHDQSATQWLGSVNSAIASIRSAGASQEVLVSGSYWDGGWTWTTTDNASVVGTGVRDPAHNFAFEVHQYLDSDGSGTHSNVVSATIGVDRLTAVTNWAESTGSKLFLGEIGVATDQTSLQALDNTLSYVQQHAGAWQGVTYWAGGPWWGNYMYSIEPQNGVDKPQMQVLVQHETHAA